MSQPMEPRYDGSEIAVVGLAGRFPGASDIHAFWRNLRNGVESIRFFTDAELLDAGEDPERVKDPAYVKARPVLDGVDRFDAAFFGLNPREAEVLDPQHRVFLECAWEALEHAGHDPARFKGAISLFAGASFSNYLVHNLYKNRPVMESFGDLLTTIYNVPDSLTTMAAYKLDLKGACCAVQTFCSTSLVAVHLAGQSLLNYESDLALAGGVTVYVPQTSGYVHEEGSIVSRDGHCRAFDAKADGTVFGNGVGIVVLRRLEDALRDGDTVHAVILGSAVNNDGTRKVSFAAPGVVGQTAVVVEALAAAEVDPATIGYVEAHGTGTRLGDPAEVSALTKAFGTDRKGFCALGSVKTNVGHLDAAAGVSGLIKVILALEHREIPPSLHFETPNPDIDFASSPFFVNTTLRDWTADASPRRAGVSAFGVGGTNAHVVLEEAPEAADVPSRRAFQLLVLSAKTGSALEQATANLADHIEAHPDVDLADVAWTLQAGRRAFAHRRVAVCHGPVDAAAVLRGKERGRLTTAVGERRNPPVVLVFPAQGRVSPAALRELCATEPAVDREIERGLAASGARGADLRRVLEEGEGGAGLAAAAALLVQHALGRLLLSWGVRPEALVAEGSGERAARVLAGVDELGAALESALDGTPILSGPEVAEPAIPIVPRSSVLADDARLLVELRPDLSAAGLLEALGALWLGGVDVDWTAVHAPDRRRRVPLPAYPFERRRFWVDPLPEEPASPAPAPSEPSDWLYRPCWKSARPAAPSPERGLRHLLFVDGTGLGAALAERLAALGDEVVTVEPATFFAGEPATGYRIDPGRPEHYEALWDDLVRRNWRPGSLVHLWTVDPVSGRDAHERFTDASLRGFLSLLHLARAAVREGGACVGLRVVAAGLHEVLGGEPLDPEKAPLLALLPVLSQEHEGLRCATVDVERSPHGGLAALADALAAEVRSVPADSVALRRGRRWVQQFERVEGRAGQAPRPAVREGGTYLITGGLGNVGFAHAVGLARAARVKLVLTGRSPLPSREEWDGWLSAHEPTEPTAVRIRRVRALESAGIEVMALAADVADERAMAEVVAVARERFGAIHGVVHAAGELGDETFRAVRDLPLEACTRQFRPKVHGLLVLDRLLGKEPLDFWLLTSSLSTVLGGYGYAAYAGANAFLDAFAALRAREGGARWLSVDWDQWEFPGVVRAGRPAAASGLLPEHGVAVLHRALGLLDLDRLVVSTSPLEARLRRWVRLEEAPAEAGTNHGAPRDEDAGVLAGIEKTLLAHEAVTAAVALFRENGRGGEPPVAYVVFGGSFGPTVTELRSWLKDRLPAGEVPSTFVVLDALPLAADGSVDRRQLARLDSGGSERAGETVAARTAMETLVADIWRDVLGVEHVSVHDNFFNLGGHSLLAVRVIGRIEKAVGLRLDPRDLIFQTLEQLAAACEERSRTVGGRV